MCLFNQSLYSILWTPTRISLLSKFLCYKLAPGHGNLYYLYVFIYILCQSQTYPRLQRNFVNRVFACVTINFGLNMCCFDHIFLVLHHGAWPICPNAWDLNIDIEPPPPGYKT